MGRLQAEEMAEFADLDTALSWHLRANHYPPVPIEMLTPCKEAIFAANENNWEKLIQLPEGVSYKNNSQAPASALIENYHLDAWLTDNEL